MMPEDEGFMRRAMELALLAEREGNLPVGAVIVLKGEVVAEGRSRIWVPGLDGTRHAEMEAIRAAPADLWPAAGEMSLYTTLEPCLMCLGAILLHGIGRVVYGAADGYGGASTILGNLPPFFRERMKETAWEGPVMAAACDPLHERMLALEAARSKEGRS